MKHILIISIAMISLGVKAQQLTVFYKESRKAKYSSLRSFRTNGTESDAERDLIRDKTKTNKKELSRLDYTSFLRIDNTQSIHYPQEKITNDTIRNIVNYGEKERFISIEISEKNHKIVYMDTDSKTKVSTEFAYGKNFLISEDLTTLDWILTREKKVLYGYDCKKAIIKREHYHDDGYLHKEKPIEAWYTEEITTISGPSGYWGLPGLIVSVTKDDQKITLDKIIPGLDGFKVKPPTKGKKITREGLDDMPAQLFNEN